jgi:hypothetical protein
MLTIMLFGQRNAALKSQDSSFGIASDYGLDD